MANFDKNNKLTPRPDHEPKFDPSNKVDRKIITLAIISLIVVAVLVAALVIVYELGLWTA